jgi:MATE family multidrug resistance protein
MSCSRISQREYTKELLHLAGPLILSNLAYTLLGALDTIFMGRVGTIELGAVGVASTLFVAVSAIFRGTAGGTLVMVSQAYGAGDRKRIRRSLQRYVALSALLAPLCLVLPKVFELYFALSKAQPQVRDPALTYMTIRSYEIPFSLLSKCVGSFLLGIGNSTFPMFASWLTVGINAFANYVLIFGRFGFPKLGIAGAAWGTVISQVVQTILYVGFVLWQYNKEYRLLKEFSFPGWKEMKDSFTLGFPMGLANSIDLGAFGVFLTLISRIGPIELAASQIVSQLNDLTFMPAFALGASTNSLVGRSLGQKDVEKAERFGRTGLIIGVAVVGLIGLCFCLFPSIFIAPFTGDREVTALASVLLKIVALYQLLDVAYVVFRGALNGAGRTKYTGLMTLACACILFIPVSYICAFVLGFGVMGAWIGPLAHVTCLVFTLGSQFYGGYWKERWMVSRNTKGSIEGKLGFVPK